MSRRVDLSSNNEARCLTTTSRILLTQTHAQQVRLATFEALRRVAGKMATPF